MGIAEGLNPEFIIDRNGKKKSVILSFSEYIELLEDLSDLAVVAERRDEESVPFDQVMKELKENGAV
jgi:hypothetical protein